MVWQVILPMLAILGTGAWALASYNRAVTGSALTMPYQVHEQTYGMCPNFLWQAPHEDRHYRHPMIEQFHRQWAMQFYRDQQTWGAILEAKWVMLLVLGKLFLPAAVALPLVGLPWWRGRKLREPLVVMCLFWLFTQVTVWNLPHYLAPGFSLLLLVLVYGLRNLRWATRGWDWPLNPLPLLLMAQLLLFAWAAWQHAVQPQSGWQYQRQAIQEELNAQPQQQLVFVDYGQDHDTLQEWVYNRADIDNAQVVWARGMSTQEDRKLIDYYPERQVWRLAADEPSPQLVPSQPAAR